MSEKKKNILIYIGIVVLLIIVGIIVFIMVTRIKNTADENGVSNNINDKTNVMTKAELNSYIVTFVENMGIKYDNVQDVSDGELFWFAVRVYLSNSKVLPDTNGIYKLPRKELASIIYKYFGKKDFKYDVTNEKVDIKYDEEKDIYTSELNFGISVYGEGPEYIIKVTDIVDNNDGKIAKINITFKDDYMTTENEYTCLLNSNYNITNYKYIGKVD